MAISTDTIWDAKGDLAVATGADAASRLAVTTTAGQVLVKDSATSTGVAWASPWEGALAPTGALAETYPRWMGSGNSVTLSSGRLMLQAIYLPQNITLTSISIRSGATALASGSNQWFALYNSALDLLMQTNDDTSIAWAANTVKTLNLTSTYTTTASGLFYVGVMVNATTTPTLTGWTENDDNVAANIAPVIRGNSTTGLTGAAPDPAGALTVTSYSLYAYCS